MRATIAGVQTVALQTLRAGAPRRAWSRASENALVRAAQHGSAEAFAELFRRHWPRAHRAAWLVVHDASAAGNRVWRARLPAGARVGAAAWAPRGDRIALALRESAATSVYVTRSARVPSQPVFTTSGTLRSLAWSPNGRRLLVRWAQADQWLLLSPTSADAGVAAIAGISRRFGAPPTVQGWCCAR